MTIDFTCCSHGDRVKLKWPVLVVVKVSVTVLMMLSLLSFVVWLW